MDRKDESNLQNIAVPTASPVDVIEAPAPVESEDDGFTWSVVFKLILLMFAMGGLVVGVDAGCAYTKARVAEGPTCWPVIRDVVPPTKLPNTIIRAKPAAPAEEV